MLDPGSTRRQDRASHVTCDQPVFRVAVLRRGCRGLEGKTAEPPLAFSHRGVGVARVVGGLQKDGLNEYSVPSPYRGLTGGRRGDQREQAGCRV